LIGCGSDDSAFCGDAVLDLGEACDDGNDNPGDGCFACEREAGCGDAIVDADEDCDDGNAVDGDGCTAACELELCGDLVRNEGEACDDGNTVDGDGCSADCQTIDNPRVTDASWTFKNVANDQVTGCPSGFDVAAVISMPDGGGAPLVDLFDCADGAGTIAPVPPGSYVTHIDITDNSGTLVYASSTSAEVDLTAGNGTFATTIFNDGGYFGLAWTLRGAVSNTTLTCAEASSDAVEIISTVTGSASAVSDIFTCDDGAGTTAGMLAGSYTVSISANNSQQQAVGTAPAQANKVIQAPNKVTDLGLVEIPIDGQ
jgi:cysteine-rich repeat protein